MTTKLETDVARIADALEGKTNRSLSAGVWRDAFALLNEVEHQSTTTFVALFAEELRREIRGKIFALTGEMLD